MSYPILLHSFLTSNRLPPLSPSSIFQSKTFKKTNTYSLRPFYMSTASDPALVILFKKAPARRLGYS